MSRRTLSEALVMHFFAAHNVRCRPVPTRPKERTPDFTIELATEVVCEVKQIVPNKEDLREIAHLTQPKPGEPRSSGRWIPDRIWPILKSAATQLRHASKEEHKPTLLVIYDATPFRAYSDDTDIVQAMFGRLSVNVWVDETGETRHSDTYFGSKRFFTPTMNTSFSAVGLLRGGPEAGTMTLTLFHNPYARIPLDPALFDGLPVTHRTWHRP